MPKTKIYCLHFFFIILALVFPKNLISQESEEEIEPLYCGSLLAFYPQNIPPGYISVQPYLFFTSYYGSYQNNWSLQSKKNLYETNLTNFLETGITDNIDITVALETKYSRYRGNGLVQYGDTVAWLGFQALRDIKGSATPDLRFLIGERFPTGKYQNLNPKYGGGDSAGLGSYQTSLILVLQKIFYTLPRHPFNINLNLFYVLPTKTHVSGFNTYGGGYGTKGTIHPGNIFIVNLAYEYSFTRYWEWSIDLRYRHQAKSPFQGERGITKEGTAASNGLPSSQVFSLAPAIGYNFNKIFCITWGAWFSVAGKNRDAFLSGAWTVFYAF